MTDHRDLSVTHLDPSAEVYALDPHAQIFEPIRAQELAEVVRPFRPLFYEEPLRPENIAAMARLTPGRIPDPRRQPAAEPYCPTPV